MTGRESPATAASVWRAAGRPAIVVEIRRTRGSVPRESGTRMLVADDAVVGTIGGGHLEWRAIADARALLLRSAVAPMTQTIALGPSLGQCCGGSLELHFSALSAVDPASWQSSPPRFRLQLYGAGHVGRAIVRLLDDLPCRVTWIDEREAEFPAAPSAPHVDRIAVDAVESEVATAAPGSFFLVLTHSHDLDLAIATAILRRGDFGFFGLIGSKTKRARFAHRLRDRGLAEDVVARMQCPIGVAGIVGKEPEVIAIAAVAQLLQIAG